MYVYTCVDVYVYIFMYASYSSSSVVVLLCQIDRCLFPILGKYLAAYT